MAIDEVRIEYHNSPRFFGVLGEYECEDYHEERFSSLDEALAYCKTQTHCAHTITEYRAVATVSHPKCP